MVKIRKSYTSAKKLEILEYAENNGNRAASRLYGAGETSIREWRKEKSVLQVMNPKKRSRRYRQEFWPKLETEVKKFINEKRAENRQVSTKMIRMEAKKIAKTKLKITDFKGSDQWCNRFMKRHRLSVRATTSVGQKLPIDWEEKIASFKLFVNNYVKSGIVSQQIGNMDEIPVSFDMVGSHTVDNTGAQDIKISTTGHEKSNFTVILCVTADGGKCAPLVIFKRKTMPKEEFPKGVVVKVNEKGWINQFIMNEWLDEVWRTRKNALFTSNTKSLLIWDSASAHITENVKSVVQRYSRLAVIPGGLTKKLQPLDLTVNKSFKSKLKDKWEKWMSEGMHSFTKNGTQRRAKYSEICKWIKECWDEITIDCIKNGFRKAGIYDYSTEDSSSRDPMDESTDEESENEVLSTDEVLLDELSHVIESSESEYDEDFEGF